MKKIFSALVAISLFAPMFAMADSGPQFDCLSPKLTSEDVQNMKADPNRFDVAILDIENKVRGTCKKVDFIATSVSIDPELQKEYFLGTHQPIDFGERSYEPSKYSEKISFSSSSTLAFVSSYPPKEDYYRARVAYSYGVIESPTIALFDRAYFVPLLSGMFKKAGFPFSENSFPDVSIYLYNKNEISVLPPEMRIENKDPDTLIKSNGEYQISTFKYQEYGKHIYASKGELVESQYTDIEKGTNFLSNKDLLITAIFPTHGNPISVVPITSPLKWATNYWIYTKKNGKLTLEWQKSEYGLDNGTVKTITNADKNVSASLLFNNAQVSTTPTSSVSTSTVIVPEVPEAEQKVGFIARFFNFILSWFR